MIFNVQEFYLLLLIWTPIIGPALIPFVIRKKYESIKGYSVFSIFTFLYCLIPVIIDLLLLTKFLGGLTSASQF
jgi:hypothetical protein